MSVNKSTSSTSIRDRSTGTSARVKTDISGDARLLVDSQISSVQVPLGKDPLPDTFFTITEAGAIGDTITIDINPTANDSTSPDRDYPAYNFVYTLVAADVGDEQLLAANLVDALNADNLFEAQDLQAESVVSDSRRAIVHISSIVFSLNGEFSERPNTGDFEVTTTGTTVIVIGDSYRSLLSRPKEVSLARDPNNPHRLGVQNIAGSVFIRSSNPDALVRENITEVGNSNDNMAVNGQGTPVVFEYNSMPNGGSDVIIDSLKFYGNDTNIKTQTGKFLGNNSALSNGILIELIRDGVVIFNEIIKNTVELLARFSTTASDNKIINQSGGDYFETTFSLINKNLAFVLRNGENDLVRVTIQDNLSAIDGIFMLIDGSLD